MYNWDKGYSEVLTWQPYEYLFANSTKKSTKEILHEYARLRKIANKRLKRALKNPELKNLNIIKANRKGFKALRGYAHGTIAKGLADVYKFLNTPETTLKGYRAKVKQTIESLNAAGFEFINSRNLKEFGDFMDTMRAYLKGIQVPSDYVAEAFDDYAAGNVTPEQLQSYFEERFND